MQTPWGGIEFIGQKRSSKTSSRRASPIAARANHFITNDDLGLTLRTRDVVGTSWPRSINVRQQPPTKAARGELGRMPARA